MSSSKGFKSIENKLSKLLDLVVPPQKDPIMIRLTETYATEANEGEVIELAIQPDTLESFYVEREDDIDFNFHL